jgi:Inner membrane protein YgaP-like, transmembrane domain
MTVERMLRLIAGSFVLLSLALGYWVSPYWYLFTAFVGLNLFQSGLTNWCPMMAFLRKLGVGRTQKNEGITKTLRGAA